MKKLFLLLMMLSSISYGASVYTVIYTTDSGDAAVPTVGSLRWAINSANLDSGSTIAFNLLTSATNYISQGDWGYWRIRVSSPLPNITANYTTIDGHSQVQNQGRHNPYGPEIEINGGELYERYWGGNGIEINSAYNCIVREICVTSFPVCGIELRTESATYYGSNTVQGCYVGINATGTFAMPNTNIPFGYFESGVSLYLNPSCVIGGTSTVQRNIISGNNWFGLYIGDSRGVKIFNNYIGTDRSGTIDFGNGASGLTFGYDTESSVVGDSTGTGNLISGNTENGIRIETANTAQNIQIKGNIIGLDATGTVALGNSGYGIFMLSTTRGVIVGGTDTWKRNIISGNGLSGIYLSQTSMANQIVGNYIGTDITGLVDLGNAGMGINIENSSTNTVKNNVISGNDDIGIQIFRDTGVIRNNIIIGNYIGVGADGNTQIANSGDGVFLTGVNVTTNVIGGYLSSERNIISGNTGDGIEMNGTSVNLNQVIGNYIGVKSDGVTALGNGANGVFIVSGTSNTIDSNIIAFNVSSGVAIRSTANASGRSNKITKNSMFANRGYGIRLVPSAFNPNDVNFSTYPWIKTADKDSGIVSGTAPVNCNIEVFISSVDLNGFGEGKTYMGTAVSDANGIWTLVTSSYMTIGSSVTATATCIKNNTTEFSRNFASSGTVTVVTTIIKKLRPYIIWVD